jgi:hypothetical protein
MTKYESRCLVIPVLRQAQDRLTFGQAGIQLIQQVPHCGAKPNCILNNSAG